MWNPSNVARTMAFGTQMTKVGGITLWRHDYRHLTWVFRAKIRYNIWVDYESLRIVSTHLKYEAEPPHLPASLRVSLAIWWGRERLRVTV